MIQENASRNYLEYLISKLQTVCLPQTETINEAAEIAAGKVEQGGRIYAFGSGHSAMVAEEIFARAGGLALVKAIVPDEVWAHNMPRKSTYLERIEGYADALCELYRIDENDVLLVISNSGRNALPVEMALCAKKRGAAVVAITSLAHSKSIASRHSSGKKLYEIADVVLDNGAPEGDAAMPVPGSDVLMGPVSTETGMALAQAWSAQIAQILARDGKEVPVFRSSNLDNADAYNDILFDKYHNYWK